MVKGIMCAECCYLDKTRKQYGNNGTGCVRYGCNDTKMNTKADKIRFRKKLAKARKERYIREHGCNRN